MATREEMLAKGYKYYCLACKGVFKKVPREEYHTGHGARMRAVCKRCGEDLICNLVDDSLVKD